MNNRVDLIIAFSFSLMPDGAPGSYNIALAKHLAQTLELRQTTLAVMPVVALQWEIADALSDLYPRLTDKLMKLERLIVVKPPQFLKEGVRQDLFEKWLHAVESVDNSGTGKYKLVLQTCLECVTGGLIVEKLNSLLDDDKFYQKFEGLQLNSLVRPKLGDLFTEARMLPNPKYYPHGLKTHQKIRVNRLIIEAVVDDDAIVQRGQYLSTSGVIESVFEDCFAKDLLVESVSVIGHPLHSPRCLAQSNQILSAKNINLLAQEIVMGELPVWDNSGAQVWCRSQANWEEYEGIVSGLLGRPG